MTSIIASVLPAAAIRPRCTVAQVSTEYPPPGADGRRADRPARRRITGVSGPEVIDTSHRLGALSTSQGIIGTLGITPVRRLVDAAAALVPRLLPGPAGPVRRHPRWRARDPATIEPDEWAHRAEHDPDLLVIPDAGETLFRLREPQT